MVNLKLKEHCGELVNESELTLYDGEVANIAVSVDFEYSYFYAYLNNIKLGKFRTNRFGIHSSKFVNGCNALVLDFFDEDNQPLTNIREQLIKRRGMRNMGDLNLEISELIKSVSEIRSSVDEIKQWKTGIDKERSGC